MRSFATNWSLRRRIDHLRDIDKLSLAAENDFLASMLEWEHGSAWKMKRNVERASADFPVLTCLANFA